jgi:hypothetical protein
MDRVIFAAFLFIVVVLMQSCTVENDDAVKVTGIIVIIPIDSYGIKGDDGRNYMPTNIPQEFQKDGLRIRFEAKELPGQTRVYMWGTIVELVTIQKL